MTVLWITIAAFVLLIAVGFFVAWRNEAALRRSGMYPAAGQATMADVERLAQVGQKIAAIRCYREIHRVGLAEAKKAVEDLDLDPERRQGFSASRSEAALNPSGEATMADVERFARAGQTIAAIRCYREIHRVGLAEAKKAVEDLDLGPERRQDFPASRGEAAFTPSGEATMADVERFARAGQTIAAIRCYREIHHVGLAEAKKAVEDLNLGHERQ